MKEIDFSKLLFRASQSSKLLTGTIGVTPVQDARITELINERDTGKNVNGNSCKWTANKIAELEKLEHEKKNPSLPKTMQSELRKIYRSEKYNRNFIFINKYLVKGTVQEDEAITTYQIYRNLKGHRTFFIKNTERLYGEYFQGEPDLNPVEMMIDGDRKMVGFDTKCSWDLSTFPFPEDELESNYEAQNDVYMKLTGADMWITAYVLVNCTEQLLHNEKMKHFYALGAPNEDHKNHIEYIRVCRELERQLIFDYDRFVDVYPYHNLEYSREEWMNEGNDIPLEDRVIEKITYRSEAREKFLIERAKIGRKYLAELQKQDEQKLITN